MHALTDAAPRAESEMIATSHVRPHGGIVRGAEIVAEAVWVEGARVGVAAGIHVDGVDVVHDGGAAGDAVAEVFVVGGDGVRDAADDGGGHPAQGFLDAAADILQVGLVVHGGEAVGADDAVELGLGTLLHQGKEQHRLDEAVQRVRGRVGAGFEQRAGDVPRVRVAEAVDLLLAGHVDAETGPGGAGRDAVFRFQPGGYVQGFFFRVHLLGFAVRGDEEGWDPSEDGIVVDDVRDAGLVEPGEFVEAFEELGQAGVVVVRGSPSGRRGLSQREVKCRIKRMLERLAYIYPNTILVVKEFEYRRIWSRNWSGCSNTS